uniref:Uncharacterized protein n=1 Tax=Anguilla anguilla TaxID=7936 RepID=A0A0E9QL18_ANGAN
MAIYCEFVHYFTLRSFWQRGTRTDCDKAPDSGFLQYKQIAFQLIRSAAQSMPLNVLQRPPKAVP